jgi:magnesium transporter
MYVRNGESAAEYDITKIPKILETKPRLIWIDILIENNVLGAEEISLLSESFKFHELSVEDCLLPQFQPKIEEFENYIFAAVHGIRFKAKDLSDFENAVYELDLFIGKDFVVTVHTGELLAIEALFERAKLKPQVELKSLEFLLYNIFHKVVASFEFTTDKLGDRFDEIEDRVLENPSSELMPEILSLNKILLNMRKITEPQQGVYTYFMRGTGELLSKKYSAYFREIYFKFDRINQFISSHNQMIGSILEIYVSGVTLKLNEVMKFLTIIATVFMPALLVASYYGMNVTFPEHKLFGAGRVWYFAAALIIGSTVAVYWYIKKKKWF